ncbi:28S ribosomal protein S27, mitochondrial-like [Argonauta hians]
MALPCVVRSLCRNLNRNSVKFPGFNSLACNRRSLLSEAYKCQASWDQRLNSEELQVPCNEFLFKLIDKSEKDKNISFVDIDILANKVFELDSNDLSKVEQLLHKFRHSIEAGTVTDSLAASLARGYLQLGVPENYVSLMKRKISFGIFPDFPTSNILMDHFIKSGNYNYAAQVAYEMMLQEDFSHRSSLLLSLYSCVKFLLSLPAAVKSETAPDKNEEVEESWVKVKYLNKPFYDDHFDITEPHLLLGKTLVMLGKEFSSQPLLSSTLQTYGFGLYEKFERGLTFLEKIAAGPKAPSVYRSALDKFQECLEFSKVKDPELSKKELGLWKLRDSREELRLSSEEKELYLDRFKAVLDQLSSGGYIVESSEQLEKDVDTIVTTELPPLEQEDINQQVSNFVQWSNDRRRLVQQQIETYRKAAKRKEIEEKLLEIQEKEEILTFFERKNQLGLNIQIGERKEKLLKKCIQKTQEEEEDLSYFDKHFKKYKGANKIKR